MISMKKIDKISTYPFQIHLVLINFLPESIYIGLKVDAKLLTVDGTEPLRPDPPPATDKKSHSKPEIF